MTAPAARCFCFLFRQRAFFCVSVRKPGHKNFSNLRRLTIKSQAPKWKRKRLKMGIAKQAQPPLHKIEIVSKCIDLWKGSCAGYAVRLKNSRSPTVWIPGNFQMVKQPHKLFCGMRNSIIVVLAFGHFLAEVGSESRFPDADSFCRIQ
mgnify:CR=1 FL=1